MPIIKWRTLKAFVSQINREYGLPVSGTLLEDAIDTSNIHGSLQQKIEAAELRQAALVTELLNRKPEIKDDISSIFIEQGRKAAKEFEGDADFPNDIFNALNGFILE